MTTVEMTHLDPCPTYGQHRYRIAMCQCGHQVAEHDFGTRKGVTIRTACSNGACGCRQFEEAADG
jgi:hypothetical protein